MFGWAIVFIVPTKPLDALIEPPNTFPLALMLPEAVKLVAKLAVSAFTAWDEDISNVISCEAETANKACDAVIACEDDTGIKIEPSHIS